MCYWLQHVGLSLRCTWVRCDSLEKHVLFLRVDPQRRPPISIMTFRKDVMANNFILHNIRSILEEKSAWRQSRWTPDYFQFPKTSACLGLLFVRGGFAVCSPQGHVGHVLVSPLLGMASFASSSASGY